MPNVVVPAKVRVTGRDSPLIRPRPSVTVMSRVPPSSAMASLLTSSWTLVGSSSVTVTVDSVTVPSLAPVGELMAMLKSSRSSSSLSSLKATVTDFSLSPGAKLRVCPAMAV